ncbi:methionine--tRNA ligase [Candidatus Micrarchaeota archaeon]|nr:methionine--tRNA ligase [Candidatus Micrarchaeota archaeon]
MKKAGVPKAASIAVASNGSGVRVSDASGDSKKMLITAALPYANGDLHLGGIRSTYLPADVFARYCRLQGRPVLYVCASDEHGTPIEVNAAKEKMKPDAFVKKYHDRQEKDFQKLGMSFDVFHRTHSEENHVLAKRFYDAAQEKGVLFTKAVEQTYCPKDERFLPDRFVKGTCPFCAAADQYGDGCEKCGKVYSPADLKEPHCALCKTVPTKKTTEHVFFKLSACGPFLYRYLSETNLQSDVVAYVRNWLSGLKDWDITRDGPYFGIPIPGRKDQFFYVWFDAPIGYVAATQAWCTANQKDLADWWNSKNEIVHFIGKDIVYHHYLFWPAMLDTAGFALPTRIPTRGYLNVEGEKMSKSRGTFILVKDVLARFHPDSLRYYLCTITPNTTVDGNFAWADFQAKVNSELIGAYGNFVYRCLSFIVKKGGTIPPLGMKTELDAAFEKELSTFSDVVAKDLDQIGVKEALEKIMAFAAKSNKYFNDRAPWKLTDQSELDTVLHLSAKAVFALALALSPYLPFSSGDVFAQLGVKPKSWADLSPFKAGPTLQDVKPLFARIEDEAVAEEVGKMKKSG